MPFRSKAQQRYLFSHYPKIAKEFAEKTPNIKNLPEKVDESPLKIIRKIKVKYI